MAQRLGNGLAAAGIEPVWPVDANLVFAVLPRPCMPISPPPAQATTRAAAASLPKRIVVEDGAVLARLVTSFATTQTEVDQFVALTRG